MAKKAKGAKKKAAKKR